VPTAAVSALAGYRGPPWLPQRLSLVSSQLGPEPRYTTEAEWELRAAGASSRPDR
jgi:2'-5' RNA ligase